MHPQQLPDELRLHVSGESDVALVVRVAHRFCADRGMKPLLAAHVATAASELANNLWMHSSQGGTVQLRWLAAPLRCCVELSTEDNGPGMADIALAMTEGYSTAGGLGCGLPGVQRLMDEFEIRSTPGVGTQVVARKWAEAAPLRPLSGARSPALRP